MTKERNPKTPTDKCDFCLKVLPDFLLSSFEGTPFLICDKCRKNKENEYIPEASD